MKNFQVLMKSNEILNFNCLFGYKLQQRRRGGEQNGLERFDLLLVCYFWLDLSSGFLTRHVHFPQNRKNNKYCKNTCRSSSQGYLN